MSVSLTSLQVHPHGRKRLRCPFASPRGTPPCPNAAARVLGNGDTGDLTSGPALPLSASVRRGVCTAGPPRTRALRGFPPGLSSVVLTVPLAERQVWLQESPAAASFPSGATLAFCHQHVIVPHEVIRLLLSRRPGSHSFASHV